MGSKPACLPNLPELKVSDKAVASEGNKCEGVVGTALGGRGLASVMA